MRSTEIEGSRHASSRSTLCIDHEDVSSKGGEILLLPMALLLVEYCPYGTFAS